MQIVYSSRRGSREIEHIGSAHDDVELELLRAVARQRLAAGQGVLDLGLDVGAPGGPLPITASRMGCLLDALVQFGGQGSWGNGAAMRAAPLGAWFASDLDQAVSAADTVLYAIWCAARHLDDLTEALWATVSAGGDADTTCAITGGIIAARTGTTALPARWRDSCEPLPTWVSS